MTKLSASSCGNKNKNYNPEFANKDLTVLAIKGGIVVDTTTPPKNVKKGIMGGGVPF